MEMTMITKTRKPPELRPTMVVEDDSELIARLDSLADTCLKGARMERDSGLEIGELLIKKRGDPSKRWGFNEWVAKNCKFSRMHAWRYMAAWENKVTLGYVTDDWTLTELAQGKKYEPEPEVEFNIKVATTEHPIVKSIRPKCPGVEGIGPGCWKWSEAFGEWEQQPAYVEPKPSRPPCPGVEGDNPGDWKWFPSFNEWVRVSGYGAGRDRTPQEPPTPEREAKEAMNNALPAMGKRDWIINYLKFCSEDKLNKHLETIRRAEHEDRGGSKEITAICNMYLSKEN